MARRKKKFPCGHVGYGRYCHQCAEAEKQAEAKAADREDRAAWKATFQDDPVDLSKLPNRKLVLKARQILEQIAAGEPYQQLKGKRMNYDRHVISIPVNIDYRILCEDTAEGLTPIALLSHEEYNVTKPGATKTRT